MRTDSLAANVRFRAETLARVAGMATAVALGNYALWGRFDGDDNTPLGAVKVGKSGDKTQYVDLMALTGVTRGMRQLGLQAFAEGQRPAAKRGGANLATEADRATNDIILGAIHPFAGPAVDVGRVALTGKSAGGFQEATRAKAGESQAANNVYAALFAMNPIAESWGKSLVELLGGPQDKEKKTPEQKRWEMLGPFGPKFKDKPPGLPQKQR